MNKSLTEMVFILDRSGSMASLVSDTIGGYNSLIEKQKTEEGEAAITTVLFDDQYDVVCENVDIGKVEPMTNKVYFARGMTALLDAIGKTVNTVAARQQTAVASAVPAKTVVVIMTDGMENASKEYHYADVKALIERQQKEFGWEFLFMGANIDAIGVAGKMGISADRSANYHADAIGTKKNFSAVSAAFSAVRSVGAMPSQWKKDIDEDFKGRKKQ
ncbi:MAG: VWA domain-containing protein [Clostridia bacterium]|nr:VWA domain-containing protein [Clostridia bacterium]